MMHPLRLERFTISDMNPMLWPLQAMAAGRAREPPAGRGRQSVRERPSRRSRSRSSRRSTSIATCATAMQELLSRRSTTRRWSRRSPGCARRMPMPASRGRATSTPSSCSQAKIEAIKTREEQGGFAEAVLRIMLAVAQAEHMFDARGLRLAQRIKQEHPELSAHPARADEGRRQGGGVHAALRPGARARRAAARCCRPRTSGARRSRSCGGSATPTARSRRRARPCSPRSSASWASTSRQAKRQQRAARAARPQRRPKSRDSSAVTAAHGRCRASGTDRKPHEGA